MVGKTVSHYKILNILGGGGMGVVYKAEDLRLDRLVALKFLPHHLESEELERRFILEAKTASSLDHPNICTIYEIDKLAEGQMFIAMAYYEGETLRKKLEEGALPVDRVLDVFVQVAQGLAKAHEHGIVHRDIKPANIIITSDQFRVKILDFGLAKITGDPGITKSGMAVGTLAYMSPEQARGNPVDHRTDIWSAGVMLYEMLTGRLPFSGNSEVELLHALMHWEPTPVSSMRPGVPAVLERVLRNALEKKVDRRYSSIQLMLKDLQEASNFAQPTKSITLDTGSGARPPSVPLGATERRSVTAIVTILNGYTEMIENMMPSEVEAFLFRLQETASRIAQQHGGILNQFAANQFTVLFGIPVSHEDDYIRAIRFVLQFHKEVQEAGCSIQEKAGRPIQAQSGVNSGLIIAEMVDLPECTYRVSGATVTVAARLAQEAEEGEILITPECRRLIAPFFEVESRSAITFKGKQEMVPYRVLSESGLQTRLEAAEKAGFTPLMGRDRELQILRQSMDIARGGEGRLVTVSGEVGIGKSRLLYEFQNALDTSSIRLVRGRCQSFGNQISYLPFIEALKDLLQIEGDQQNPDLFRQTIARIQEIGQDLVDFVPIYLHLLSIPAKEFAIPKHLQGEDLRLMIQEALTVIFAQSSRQKPLVLILEDWHWSDEASRDVLRQMTEILSSYPALIVVSYRPEGNSGLTNSGEPIAIHLSPIDILSANQIVRFAMRAEIVPEDLVKKLYDRTGGNPFFLEELCHSLREAGKIKTDGRAAILSEDIENVRLPDTVEAVIQTRLDRLDFQDREVLKIASVIGREFSRPVLQRAMGESAPPLRSVETLKAMGLIQQISLLPEPTYRFKHILTQQVAYDSMLPHKRKSLHGVIGRILEELYADRTEEYSELLSNHYSRAEEWKNAVLYGQRSALKANRLGRFKDALEHLQTTFQWLMNLPDDSFRREKQIELLLSQERLMETLGLRDQQQRIIDELLTMVESSGDPAQISEVYCRQGDLFTLLGRYEEADKVLSKSMRLAEQLKDPVQKRKALRSIGFLLWREGLYEESVAVNQEAIAISRSRQEMQEVAADLANLGNVLRNEGKYDLALNFLEEALEIYEHQPDYLKQSTANYMVGNIYRDLGDLEKALLYIQKALDLSVRHRLVITQVFSLNSIANICWQQGKLEESLNMHQEALELNRRIGYADGLAQSLRNVGEILLASNREKDALPYFLESGKVFAQLENSEAEASMYGNAALIQEHLSCYAEAEQSWMCVCELRNAMDDRAGEIQALEGMARMIRLQGKEPEAALKYYERASALAQELGDLRKEAEILNSTGIVEWSREDYAGALKHYEKALELFQELGDPVHEGFMLNSIGVTCIRLERYDRAETALMQAAEINRNTRELLLEGHTLAILGELWQKKEDWEKSKSFFEQSLEIRRRIGDRRGEGWMLYQLARIQEHFGQTDPARVSLEGAMTIAEVCGDIKLKEACSKRKLMPDEEKGETNA